MAHAAGKRFQALDVFRGLTICFMIIVNTPGDYTQTFSPLLHADWHGFTPTDLVFPSFLFAVGNALSFVMVKWAGMSNKTVVLKILRRTALIFLVGYLMYWFPFVSINNGAWELSPWSDTRVFGVLQRIALCYGTAALLLHYLQPRTVYLLSAASLVLYWGLLYWLAPSGADPLSLEGNAVLRIDKWLLGESHLYHGEGIAFDPEGLLSTLPAVVNVVAGFAAGRFIQQKGILYETLAKLLLAGVLLVFLAYCWNFFFPVNKKLWTSSFVLLTVGLDLMVVAAILYLTDFAGLTRWTNFFEVFGKNPLVIYLLSELIAILLWFFHTADVTPWYQLVFRHGFAWIGPYFASLAFALAVMLMCWLVGYWMDRRRIYVRL